MSGLFCFRSDGDLRNGFLRKKVCISGCICVYLRNATIQLMMLVKKGLMDANHVFQFTLSIVVTMPTVQHRTVFLMLSLKLCSIFSVRLLVYFKTSVLLSYL